MTILQEKHYTVAEFLEMVADLPDDKQYELADGELYIMPPSSKRNAYLANRLGRLIGNFVEEHDLGYVFGADGGYPVGERSYLIPDVSFVSKKNSPTFPDDDYSPPDLVIEVISPSEYPRMISRKAQRYIAIGTSLVWNIFPDEKVVEVWRRVDDDNAKLEFLDDNGTLSGDDVLPNFELQLSDLFEGI